jgi:hypothetical protein
MVGNTFHEANPRNWNSYSWCALVISLKQFSLWAFNRRRKVPAPGIGGEMDESFSNNGTSRHRRRHDRAWNPTGDYSAIERD